MPIRRSPRERNFTTIPNETITDERLSWKARGLLVYLLSKPDHWEVRIAQLASASDQDGICAVKSALKELRDAGYAKIEPVRSPDNKYLEGNMYIVNDLPIYQAENHTDRESYGQKTDLHSNNGVLVKTEKKVNTENNTYTVESKFFSDSTSPLNGNGRPPKGEPKTFELQPGFRKFWEAWPPSHRKVSKRTCAAVWARQRLEPRTDEVIATMTAWARTEQWQSGFDPSPITWLRQCRYDDGLPEVIQNHKPTQRLPWHEHADHRVRRFTNGPYCETCARVLMSHEVPPKKE